MLDFFTKTNDVMGALWGSSKHNSRMEHTRNLRISWHST